MTEPLHNLLEQHFDTAFAAPDGIKKLRELILTLAMQGKLVAQDPNDPPASELLKQIEAEKQRLHASSSSRKQGSSGKKDLDSRLRGNDGIRIKSLPPIKREEVPYELPQGWEWVMLPNITFFQEGPGIMAKDFRDTGIPLIRIAGMHNDLISLKGCNFLDEDIVNKRWTHFRLELGDIILSSSASLGKVSKVGSEAVGCIAYTGLIRFKPYACLFDDYLISFLNSNEFLRQINKSKTGAAIMHFGPTHLKKMVIPLPPLPEQHRIVAKIDQLMARCDELEALRKARDEKRRAVHAAAIKILLDTSTSFPRKRESSSSEELDLRPLSTREQACGGDGVSARGWNFIQQHFGELYTVKENVAELRKTILQLAVMGCLVPQDPNDPPARELLKQIEAEKQRLHASSSRKNRGSSGVKDLDSRSPSTRGQACGNDGTKTKSIPPIKPEEVPYQLPKGWEWVRLSTCGYVFSGNAFKSQDFNTQSGVRVIKITNAGVGKLIETTEYLPEIFVYKYSEYLVQKDDLILALTRPYISSGLKISICSENYDGALLNQRVAAIRWHVPSLFYYLYFSSPQVLKSYQDKFRNTGLQPNLKMSDITNLLLPLPPLPEQHRIVAKVDQLMTLCDQLEQQIDAASNKQRELLDAVMSSVS